MAAPLYDWSLQAMGSNTITIGRVMKGKASECAACAPFRHNYRDSLIPFRCNDTGEVIVLGAKCIQRIFHKFYQDHDLDHSRSLSATMAKVRRFLIIDLNQNFPSELRGNVQAELDFLNTSQAQSNLIMSASDLRLYLANDILERKKAQQTTKPSKPRSYKNVSTIHSYRTRL